MVLPNQKFKTVIMPTNIRHYQNLGYDVKIRQTIYVPPEHLPPNSHIRVLIKCDKCGKMLGNDGITWQKHKIRHDDKYGDLCYNCAMKYKQPNIIMEKYGVANVLKHPQILEKIAQTNLKKYGVTNPFLSSEIQKQIIQTNLKKIWSR